MASKVTPSLTSQDATQESFDVAGLLAVAAGSYPANGLPVSFIGLLGVPNPQPRKNCTSITGLSGYVFIWDDGHQTLRIFESAGSAAPLVEVSTTTPTAVVNDTISFRTKFVRG
jgi:hypothetical protein